jgi:hypothetical protein
MVLLLLSVGIYHETEAKKARNRYADDDALCIFQQIYRLYVDFVGYVRSNKKSEPIVFSVSWF